MMVHLTLNQQKRRTHTFSLLLHFPVTSILLKVIKMKRKADLDGCEPRKRVCKDGARTKAKITRVSEEMCAQSPYAGLERHMHLEAKQGTFTFGAAATAKISAGRVRAKRSIVSAEANSSDASEIVVTEIDAEGKYAEGGAYVHLETKQGTFRFGAGATAKVSAGRVRAKRSIVSAEANSSSIVDIEGPYSEAEANMNVERTQRNLEFLAKARAKVSAGRIRVTEDDVSAEASGPNASAMFVANNKEAQIMVGAEIASASVSAGPVGMKVGLGVETGARVGDDGAEVKVLGCGMSIGRTMGASFFGNELKFRLW
nr:uncharacterized protein LOC111849629 [Paramormyrops kingsleyae]